MGRSSKKSPKIESPGNVVTTPAILQEYEQQRKFFGKKDRKPEAAAARGNFGKLFAIGTLGVVALTAVVYFASRSSDSSSSSTAGDGSESFWSGRSSYFSFSTLQASCVQDWNQCGGRNYNGPSACCNAPKTNCSQQDEWYSQCIPEGFPTFPPVPTVTTTEGCQPDWAQCGGLTHPTNAPTCCEHSNFKCVKQDEWYSQCIPRVDPDPVAFYDFENAAEILQVGGILRAHPNSAYNGAVSKIDYGRISNDAFAVAGKDGNTVQYPAYYDLGNTDSLGPQGFSLSVYYMWPSKTTIAQIVFVKSGQGSYAWKLLINDASNTGSLVTFSIWFDQNCISDPSYVELTSIYPSYDQWVELKASYIPPKVGSTEAILKVFLNGNVVQKIVTCAKENGRMVESNSDQRLFVQDLFFQDSSAPLIDSLRIWDSAVDIF